MQVWESLYKRANEAERGMYITTLLLHPRSVGTIRLQSANPQDDPLIDPKLLTDTDDVHTLVDGKCTALLIYYTYCMSSFRFRCPACGRGTPFSPFPPLSIHFLIFCSFLLFPFRSSPASRRNKAGLKCPSVRTSVRSSVHKKFLRF